MRQLASGSLLALYFQTEIIRFNFNSIIDIETGTHRFSFDILHDPEITSESKKITLYLRSKVKKSCRKCKDRSFFNIEKFAKKLSEHPEFFQLIQYKDGKTEINDKTGIHTFRSHYKTGNPSSSRRINEVEKSYKTSNASTFAESLKEWLAVSTKNDYIELKSTMPFIENTNFQDFLFGVSCRTSILEVLIMNSDGTYHAALVLYNPDQEQAVIFEAVVDQQEGDVLPSSDDPQKVCLRNQTNNGIEVNSSLFSAPETSCD